MNWLAFITNIASHIPIERVLFPERDNTKSLEKFAATLSAPVVEKEPPPEQKMTPTTTQGLKAVATACIPCALGHFSASAGTLNEAVRFKEGGITSNEIADRVAIVLKEQNTLERIDLTPEKIKNLPDWERDLAEEALQQSRSLRHRLETIKSIEELEAIAADTEGYYRGLNREWWKRRFAKIGETKPEMTLEDAKKMAANEAVKEVEARWPSQGKK